MLAHGTALHSITREVFSTSYAAPLWLGKKRVTTPASCLLGKGTDVEWLLEPIPTHTRNPTAVAVQANVIGLFAGFHASKSRVHEKP